MILKRDFSFKTKVWIYPGDGGWHFVTLDQKYSNTIRQAFPRGFVKIEVKIGKSIWQTSLFPHKLSKGYILCINKSIRKKENIFAGDIINLKIKIL